MLQQVEEKVREKFGGYIHWSDSYQLKILWLMLGIILVKKVTQYLDAKMG